MTEMLVCSLVLVDFNCLSKCLKFKNLFLKQSLATINRLFIKTFLFIYIYPCIQPCIIIVVIIINTSIIKCRNRYNASKKLYEQRFQYEIEQLIAQQATGYEAARLNRFVLNPTESFITI